LEALFHFYPFVHLRRFVFGEQIDEFAGAGQDHAPVVGQREALGDHAVHVVGQAGVVAVHVEQAARLGVIPQLVPGQILVK